MPNIDTEKVLSAHNKWRQEVGTPDLTWSDDLAKFAQEWANKLAKDNSFEHRPDNKYGENIYQGTKKSVAPQEVVDYWASEKKDFKYGTFPDVVKDPQKDWSMDSKKQWIKIERYCGTFYRHWQYNLSVQL